MPEGKFSNDATTKILGIPYQKLIALECCFNAKKNDFIWIECKGDVADDKSSIEVKHHLDTSNITSNSVDVWTTIKNYVVEFDIVEQFTSLILQTTAIAQNDSIFYGWNKLSAKEKKEKLFGNVPSTTIKEYHKKIIEFNENNLLKILEKFKIIEGQPNILEKWKELMEHPTLTIIPDNYKDSALQKLLGYITKKAIDNPYEWKININDFKKDIQIYLSLYTTGNTPFPIIDKNEVEPNREERKFVFIDKMKVINIKEKDQTNAIADYLRANISQIKLLEMTPTLSDSLEIYDANVKRSIEDEKSSKSIEITIERLNTEEIHNISKQLYFACINGKHDSIIGVDNTQKYYRDGRIHNTLERTNFEWKFNKGDL